MARIEIKVDKELYLTMTKEEQKVYKADLIAKFKHNLKETDKLFKEEIDNEDPEWLTEYYKRQSGR